MNKLRECLVSALPISRVRYRRTIILQLFQSAEIAKPTGVPHFSNLLHAVCANMTPCPVCDSVYLGIPHVREAHDCSKYSLGYSSPDE